MVEELEERSADTDLVGLGAEVSDEGETDDSAVAGTLALSLPLGETAVDSDTDANPDAEADPGANAVAELEVEADVLRLADVDSKADGDEDPELDAVTDGRGPVDADSRRQTTEPFSSSISTTSL